MTSPYWCSPSSLCLSPTESNVSPFMSTVWCNWTMRDTHLRQALLGVYFYKGWYIDLQFTAKPNENNDSLIGYFCVNLLISQVTYYFAFLRDQQTRFTVTVGMFAKPSIIGFTEISVCRNTVLVHCMSYHPQWKHPSILGVVYRNTPWRFTMSLMVLSATHRESRGYRDTAACCLGITDSHFWPLEFPVVAIALKRLLKWVGNLHK